MRSTILTSIIAALSLLLGVAALQAQSPVPRYFGGVGPAIAGTVDASTLPAKSRKFIAENFAGNVVVEIEKEFAANSYDVELSNGSDIEFNQNGEWIEIDAGSGTTLPEALVRKLLPRKAFDELKKKKMDGYVESIKRTSKGFDVELREVIIDNFSFDTSGKLLHSRR